MDFDAARREMVSRQLAGRGIEDPRVLEAMATVPRERFVPPERQADAYADGALPIGADQTISQPWIVAAIVQALTLTGSERVLDVGAGSGYSTAVISRLAREVVGVERIVELAERAAGVLAELGITNARIVADDATRAPDPGGWDAIAVHAAVPKAPPALLGALAPGGRMVVPIAEGRRRSRGERLTLIWRGPRGPEHQEIAPVRFVPLIGVEGYADRGRGR